MQLQPSRSIASRGEVVRFAHPAEAVIARLLDSFGVRWLYEPTTFPLVTSESGKPVQCFTPDFFLPEQAVYIEMTTMRQSLVTRKNRKFRQMRERYPDVDVRILYRKDVDLIVQRYGGEGTVHRAEIGPLLATGDQVQRKALEIATVLATADTRPLALIALGRGAARFRDRIAGELAARGTRPAAALLSVSSGMRTTGGRTTFELGSKLDLAGYRRVLIADVVGTGLTMATARAWLCDAGLPIDGTAALLERRSARLIDEPLLVPGIQAPSTWLVGAGLGRGTASIPDLHLTTPPIAES